MASFQTFSTVLFLYYLCSLASAIPWIVTSYLEEITKTGLPATSTGSQLPTGTWVVPTVDSPTAVQTWTTVGLESDVTYVNVLLEPSQGRPHTESPGYGDYYVQITPTWPVSCTRTTGTFTTEMPVYVPYDIRWALTPTSTSGRALYLDPIDVPPNVMSGIESAAFEYGACNYASGDDPSCITYTHLFLGSEIGAKKCCSGVCHHIWGIEHWHLAPIIIGAWFGFFLIVGLISNMIGFRSLMIGKRASRGLPGAFICLLPLLSCLLLCFRRPGFQARPPEEQAELKKQWKEMSFGRKVALWFRWGFSNKYPPMLGTPPPRSNSNESRVARSPAVATTATQPRDSSLELAPPAYSAADPKLPTASVSTNAPVAQPMPTAPPG